MQVSFTAPASWEGSGYSSADLSNAHYRRKKTPGCHTQGTVARHPTTVTAGLSRDGYATSTKDFSSGNPVLPGSAIG